MKKGKLKNAVISIAMAALLLSGGCGGADGGNSVEPVSENDVEIWAAAGTEKILQTKLTGYEGVKSAPAVDLYAVKGENEGSQLILTAEKNVSGVDLLTADLTLQADGETKFSASNIKIFFEKYLSLTSNYEKNGAELGNYPDALVPLSAIKNRGENIVSSGNNQGLYVRFDVPQTQKAGVYFGSFTLQYSGYSKQIPVRLEVLDFAIGEETHLRTLFIDEWQYRLGELDSTQAMLEKYVEAGFEYRISPAGVTIEKGFSDTDLDYYVETASKFMKNPKCTHISLPLKSKYVDGLSAIDGEVLEKTLHKFVEKSIADNFNYVEKLGCHLVDEPQLHNGKERTHTVTKIYYAALNKVADEIFAMQIDEAWKQELADSVRNIRGIVTASYSSEYAYNDDTESGIKTWCPTVDFYNSETARDKYDEEEKNNYPENEEKWWYTCISPRTPYPTYHIEDTLLSARVLSWMQGEYDVTGNLYWATNIYAYYNGSAYENIEDFYSGNASRYEQVNGDGFLFYPGKVYGIDGPVGSLRLEAIRDGIEEYEIMYALKQKYAALNEKIGEELGESFNEKEILRSITSYLYNGTQVATNSSNFNYARKTLINLAMLGENGSDFTFLKYRNDDAGTVTASVYLNDGYTLSANGKAVAASKKLSSGGVYELRVKLDGDTNMLNLRIESTDGTQSYEYVQNLGGKVLNFAPQELVNAFTSDADGFKSEAVSGDEIGEIGYDLLKLSIPENAERTQKFKITGAMIESIDANTKNVIVKIYCSGLSEEIDVTVSAKTTNSSTEKALYGGKLKNGWNTVELTFNALALGNTKLQHISFILGRNNEYNGAKTLYFGSVVVAGK